MTLFISYHNYILLHHTIYNSRYNNKDNNLVLVNKNNKKFQHKTLDSQNYVINDNMIRFKVSFGN